MPLTFIRSCGLALLGTCILAHGNHGDSHQAPMPAVDDSSPGGIWAATHMASEHHISNFDAHAFFLLHDFDSNGHLDSHEIYRLYGLEDEHTSHVSQADKDAGVQKVLQLYDSVEEGSISYDQWFDKLEQGVTLPDFGWGPGHHGDPEQEYELHHYEKYHDENTRMEDLIHPEDIEHFKMHDRLDKEAEMMAEFDKRTVVEENIPAKFRSNS